MSATISIGPIGGLVEVRSPEPGSSVPLARGSSQLDLLGGGRAVQRSQQARRSWNLSWPWLSQPELARIVGLEAGVHGSDLWFCDPFAMTKNMLPPAAAVPGALGDWSQIAGQTGVSESASMTLPSPDGRVVITSFEVATEVGAKFPWDGEQVAPLPVVPGDVYTFSVYVDIPADTTCFATLYWLDADGGDVSDVSGGESADGLHRVSISAEAPAGAHALYVQVYSYGPNTLQATALQLTQTPAQIEWFPGVGLPRVAIVDGMDDVYERISGAGVEESVSLTLVEL